MLRRFSQWWNSFKGGTEAPKKLLGPSSSPSAPADSPKVKLLEDADYEYLLTQLLEGVTHGWQSARVKKFFDALGERGKPELWIDWLRRFGQKLQASPTPDTQLAARLVQLGQLGCGKIGEVAYEVGMQVLNSQQGEPVWEYAGVDVDSTIPDSVGSLEPRFQATPGESITLDELLVRLQQDTALLDLVVRQLGIDTTDPQVIIDTLTNQFNAAAQVNTEQAETLALEGYQRYEAGDFIGALAKLNKALEIKPDSHPAWYYRGLVLMSLSSFKEALHSFDKALEFRPGSYASWYNKAVVLVNLGKFEEAIINFNKAIEIKPDFAEGWLNLGNFFDDFGRFEEALDSFEKAIQIKPDYHEVWNSRGNVLRTLKRFEESLASYEKTLEIKPDYYESCYNKGNVLSDLERWEEAIADYDKFLGLQPNSHLAWYNRGKALGHLERWEEAIANYEKAIKIKPDYSEAWDKQGQALQKLGRLEEAIDSYEKAIEIKPDYSEAWNDRGNTLQELKRPIEAQASFDKAKEFQSSPVEQKEQEAREDSNLT